jgi:hypothetical protein
VVLQRGVPDHGGATRLNFSRAPACPTLYRA